MKAAPCTIADAKEFVRKHHRHHTPPQGALWAVSATVEGLIVGVAIVGRPVARKLDARTTAEITRLCTDGTPNACSFLYAVVTKVCRLLGYQKVITYLLATESGTSLKALKEHGWKYEIETPGKSWSVPTRERDDKHPIEPKVRWGCLL